MFIEKVEGIEGANPITTVHATAPAAPFPAGVQTICGPDIITKHQENDPVMA